jgi:hypothetical protein
MMLAAFVFELILTRFWVPFYFRKGIPLFRRSFRFSEGTSIPIDFLTENLSSNFQSPSWLRLHNIFHIISNCEIAVRDAWFLKPNITTMRGFIRIDNEKRKITVIGYLNWYVLFVLCFFPLNILADTGDSAHIFKMFRYFILTLVVIIFFLNFRYKMYPRMFKYLEGIYNDQ